MVIVIILPSLIIADVKILDGLKTCRQFVYKQFIKLNRQQCDF